jgi:hypothetical protein
MNKSKLYLSLTLIFFTKIIVAQESYHSKFNFSAAYGAPNIPKLFFNFLKNEFGNRNFYSKGFGPLHFKGEFLPHKRFGVGISVNHNSFEVGYETDFFDTFNLKVIPNKISIKSTKTAVNIRLNFHFLDLEEIENHDLYFGAGVGYHFGLFNISSNVNYIPKIKLPNLVPVGVECTLGYRYYFGDLGLFTELGYAKSLVQFGLNYRIRNSGLNNY